MSALLFLTSLLSATHVVSSANCTEDPIDLNTATLEELDALSYISSSTAQMIIDLRPICSPLELTSSPKKISGITVSRLSKDWNWYSGDSCAESCCLAVASCDSSTSSTTFSSYSWHNGSWSDCSLECGTGTQHRDVTCIADDTSTTVDDTLCLSLDTKPVGKQLCNTHNCPVYEWVASEWSGCSKDSCIQNRNVHCYDTESNEEIFDSICDSNNKPEDTHDCDQSVCSAFATSDATTIPVDGQNGDVSVQIDLLHELNTKECHRDSFTNVHDDDPEKKRIILRRSCAMDIWVFINDKNSQSDIFKVDGGINTFSSPLLLDGGNSDGDIDASWFYIDAELQTDIEENVGTEWNDDYVSWSSNNATSGWLTLTFPADAKIGEFDVNIYYQPEGNADERELVYTFNLYLLFNPYSSKDVVYMSSTTNRKEYVENDVGLIWQGLSDDNTGFRWEFGQNDFKNLEISMNLLDRLALEYRNDTVLISRQISYAVNEDICYGKWGPGSYTTGRPSGGYTCSKTKESCHDPSTWTGTTELFDVYRDVLDRKYPVQYCQCFVYAGVVKSNIFSFRSEA